MQSRRLRILVLTIGAVLLVVTATGFALPARFTIEKSTTIAAAPAQILPYLTSFQRWGDWSDFGTAHDPEMKLAYSGPASGTGNTMSWTEGSTPPGKMVILNADDGGIVYDLVMANGFALHGSIALVADGAATTVTWRDEGDMGANPYKHIVGKIIASSIGETFETSLAKLKHTVENAR
jgi:hypothetical protein